MIASNDQMRAINAGIVSNQKYWGEIKSPTWPFAVPDWCGGVHVDMMLGWANSPRIKHKQVTPMPPMGQWKRNASRWYRTSADGHLLEQFWHSGAPTFGNNGERITPRQEGFGGRKFRLDDVEGLGPVTLWGPWFGGCPDGYNELTVVDWSKKPQPAWYRGRSWTAQGGTFGLYISDAMLINTIARFQPHLALAYVCTHGDRPRVEPYLHEWGCPKDFRANKLPGEGK